MGVDLFRSDLAVSMSDEASQNLDVGYGMVSYDSAIDR